MKKLIEKAQKELTRRILSGEYELVILEEHEHIDYVCDVTFNIDAYVFRYSVSKTFICDHSIIQISEDSQLIIDHFIDKFEEKFNTEEIRQAEIKKLEEKIKQLKNK